MNKNLFYIVTLIMLFRLFTACKNKGEHPFNSDLNQAKDSFNYLPTSTTNAVINHRFYSLSYHENYENPEWVAYTLTPSQISRYKRKRPWFKRDPFVKTLSPGYKNYYPNGYEKGHLVPAADRQFSKYAFNETFLTSNVSPMSHKFNSGIWNDLEKQVRYWSKHKGKLYIVTGGILSPDLPRIGYEKVAVPKYFYKIVLANPQTSKPELIAFLIPQNYKETDLKKYLIPVDSLEKLTGIDFFPALPDAVENKIEAINQSGNWSFIHFKTWQP